MADGTKIEWAEATANFLNGCTVLSPGCTNCYAMRLAGTRMKDHPTRRGLTVPSRAGPVWTGEIRPHWPALAQVLSWTRPREIFWNAHGDLFHADVPDALIDANIAAIALTPQHRHQLLTKRSDRMVEYFQGLDRDGGVGRVFRLCRAMNLIWENTGHHRCAPRRGAPFVPHPLPNLWMGVSAEDQRRWDERVSDLRRINVAVRWVSAEPLLGPIEDADGMRGIDWLVVGGESGRDARPMHPQWAKSLRDQCQAANVPFFFKQWGEWAPVSDMSGEAIDRCYTPPAPTRPLASRRCKVDQLVFHADGRIFPLDHRSRILGENPALGDFAYAAGKGAMMMMAIGKKAADRLLDGVEHSGMPGEIAGGRAGGMSDNAGDHRENGHGG